MRRSLGILPCWILLALSAVAQDSLQSKQLEALVVTGQYEPQSAMKSVYKVRTIPLETIQARGSVKLQDVLNTELNMRFTQDAALGGSNLSMQGLPGQNVKVLIDGVPMVGRQGTSNEININQINVNSVERIEIIEGPMSVVYGADALAGVINIITRKSNEGKVDVSATIHEESVGGQYGIGEGIHNERLGVGYSWNSFRLRGDFSRNNFGGWTGDSTGREKTWHPKEQWLASSVFGFQNSRTNLYYRLDYLNEDIYNPGNFVATEALDQHYITDRFMHQVQADHAFSGRMRFNAALAYTDYSRRTQTSTVDEASGDVRLALGSGLQDVTKFKGTTFRNTIQYKVSERFSLQPGIDLNYETGEGGRIKAGTQFIGDYAFFISGEWNLSKVFQLRPGLRMIYNTVYAAPPVVPSINAKILLSEKQQLRISYGRGFRAPSLRELYFDFFDASHSIEGNPDLQAELSHSFNASWNWKVLVSEPMTYASEVGAFYNHVDQMIGFGQKPSNPLVTSYINIDKYRTQGMTWMNTFRTKTLDASAGISYTGRFNQLSEQTASASFTWSPEFNSTMTYRFTKPGLSVSFFYKYTGSLPYYVFDAATNVVHLEKVSGYNWADLTVQKSLLPSLTLGVGIRNLFDVITVSNTSGTSGTHGSAGSQSIGYGRSYFIDISYSLHK